MSQSANIAKNASYLVIATTLNKVLAFIGFTLIARWSGPQVTGIYFFGVSVTSIFVTLADLGMTPVIIRAIAGQREQATRYLSAAIRAKCVLAPIAIICALAYGYFKQVDALTFTTIGVACLVMTADTFHLVLYGILRGHEKLQPEAIGMLIGQILTTIVAISVAYLGLGPVALAAALLLGSLWNVFWALVQFKKLELAWTSPIKADFLALMHEAAPFAIAGIAVKVYSYVDSLLIQAFHGEQAVGYYSVAYKLTYALQFLPLTFTAALYPALSRAWAKQSHQELRETFIGSLRFMAAVSFPLAAGLSGLAGFLIKALYGKAYLATVPVLEILPWVLIPIFLDFPVGSLLNASHRARLKTTAMVATMFINVLLNAVLVPSMGPVGAAWAAIFSFWSLYLIGAVLTAKDAGGWKIHASILTRTTIASIASWIAWHEVGEYMPIIPTILFGSAVAVCAAFLFRLITVDDIRRILGFRRASIPDKMHAS